MDILVKDMEPARILDIFDKAGVRFNENGEAIKFEIFHNDVKPVRHGRWERPEEPSWTVNSACRCQICGWIVIPKAKRLHTALTAEQRWTERSKSMNDSYRG